MSAFLRKYGVATAAGTNIGIPMPKAGSADFATGSDWTPAAGDVKVSIDGGAQANIATLPTYTNGQWVFALSSGEMTGKSIRVAIVDSATKAVDDQFFIVETYGNASALHPFDLGTPSVAQSGDSYPKVNTNLDVVLSTRLATSGYTVPPTVIQVRQEMDTNSTKLANLDVVLSTRLATSSYTAAPTAVQVRQEMDTNSTKLLNLDATISSRAAASALATTQTDTTYIRAAIDAGQIGFTVSAGDGTATDFTVTGLSQSATYAGQQVVLTSGTNIHTRRTITGQSNVGGSVRLTVSPGFAATVANNVTGVVI